jgi:hypothetical protein
MSTKKKLNSKGNISIAWCDNGMVDGLFANALISTVLHKDEYGLPITGVLQVRGNQIAKQRQQLFDDWDTTKYEWLLWIDSDVVVLPHQLKMLWDLADPIEKPVVCGVYFVSPNPNDPLMTPFPCIFHETTDSKNTPVHPLPVNQVIKIKTAGMGLVLMHCSIKDKLKSSYPDEAYFDTIIKGVNQAGEDISFFNKLKEINVPVYAHTGVIAKHMKTVMIDENYYALWWNTVGSQISETNKK